MSGSAIRFKNEGSYEISRQSAFKSGRMGVHTLSIFSSNSSPTSLAVDCFIKEKGFFGYLKNKLSGIDSMIKKYEVTPIMLKDKQGSSFEVYIKVNDLAKKLELSLLETTRLINPEGVVDPQGRSRHDTIAGSSPDLRFSEIGKKALEYQKRMRAVDRAMLILQTKDPKVRHLVIKAYNEAISGSFYTMKDVTTRFVPAANKKEEAIRDKVVIGRSLEGELVVGEKRPSENEFTGKIVGDNSGQSFLFKLEGGKIVSKEVADGSA